MCCSRSVLPRSDIPAQQTGSLKIPLRRARYEQTNLQSNRAPPKLASLLRRSHAWKQLRRHGTIRLRASQHARLRRALHRRRELRPLRAAPALPARTQPGTRTRKKSKSFSLCFLGRRGSALPLPLSSCALLASRVGGSRCRFRALRTENFSGSWAAGPHHAATYIRTLFRPKGFTNFARSLPLKSRSRAALFAPGFSHFDVLRRTFGHRRNACILCARDRARKHTPTDRRMR